MLSKTKRDVSLLKEFLRMKEKDEEFKNVAPRELEDGGEYEPTTSWLFVSSFNHYLQKKGYPRAITEGQEFRKTREKLVAKQKLKTAGKGNKAKAARALANKEANVLYCKGLLGLLSLESLLNMLWLNNTQHFGLKGCQEHRNMRYGNVQLQTSADGTEFLQFSERQKKIIISM